MPILLDLVYFTGLLLLSPWLVYRAWRTGRYRRGFRSRFLGRHGLTDLHGCVWFHGVSVGEVHFLRQVLAEFRRRFPGRKCVISTSTNTGYDEARRWFPDLEVIRFPFDFSWAVRRSLDELRPALVVLAEGDLWPNFLLAARSRGIPVMVINGRMSPRSFRRYRMLGYLTRRLFRLVDFFAVQGEGYRDFYLQLGVDPGLVRVTGSIKYDGVQGRRDNPETEGLRKQFAIAPTELVWVVGSTQAPEEEIAIRIFQQKKKVHAALRLVIVPRHPERFTEVAAILGASSVPFVRRSQMTEETADAPVIMVDTVGELRAVWGLADVAFVGGSLDGRRGGQNMLEPAAYGAAVLFGPHVWNFREAAARLQEEDAALMVHNESELAHAVDDLLRDAEKRKWMGERARQHVHAHQGATARTVDEIAKLLQQRQASRSAA
jgi:3-deoxy-D-manno-octulosonic-acid transferase